MPRWPVFAFRLGLAGIALVFLFDTAVFRSGLYARWLEPRSVAGSTRLAVRRVQATTLAGRDNVLVIGNSKIGEGLSPAIADRVTAGSRLHFVNGFIAGSDLRIWYYLLREVDPDARRYRAIVLATPQAADEDLSKMANRGEDINYLAPLLRLADLASFAASFDDADLRARAVRSILFPAQPLRRDIAAFVSSPLQRRARVLQVEANHVLEMSRYPGRSEALPDLPIDRSTGLPSRWDGIDDKTRDGMVDNYFRWLRVRPPPDVVASNERYYRYWLTRIVERYRGASVPVILVEVPRGAWHGTEARVPRPGGAIAELIASGAVQALPGDAFTDIERPHNFFDFEHMNRAGREMFTTRLAQYIERILH